MHNIATQTETQMLTQFTTRLQINQTQTRDRWINPSDSYIGDNYKTKLQWTLKL